MSRSTLLLAGTLLVLCAGIAGPGRAETVNQQCGQKYQAAKAAGTLNGMTWNQFRKDCADKLKADPASAEAPAAPPATATPAAATTPANPLKPDTPPVVAAAPTSAEKPAKPATGGRAAMLAREKQCGAEWRAEKAKLIAQTPGLTWPKYWSQCNTRLKAAGQ